MLRVIIFISLLIFLSRFVVTMDRVKKSYIKSIISYNWEVVELGGRVICRKYNNSKCMIYVEIHNDLCTMNVTVDGSTFTKPFNINFFYDNKD